jgi:K+-sensing histidine kinase KdpD
LNDASDSGADSKRASFLGFVAHEVRNPLSTALWSAELLGRIPAAERAGARGEKLSAMCLRSIARVRQLVEDHFLCERLDAGGIPFRPEPVALREVLDALLARPGDRGEVTIDVDPALAVVADRTLVERALDALLAMAGAEGTAVRVGARAEAAAIALVVSGRQPAPDALEDPTKGSPSDAHGRALALPLARRIARAIGGALAATEGGYVLSLPRAEAHDSRPKPTAHP